MKIVCISDLHNTHRYYEKEDSRSLNIPKADILIIAGDIGFHYSSQVKDFNNWLKTIPCKYKILIAGNHDRYAAQPNNKLRKYLTEAIYLENSGCYVQGIKFWGSPYTPPFMNWWFLADADKRKEYWNNIPDDTDVLITHGPPYKILDQVPFGYNPHVGDSLLNNRILDLKNLKLHVFGHIHYSAGVEKIDNITYVNASICNEDYAPVNDLIILDNIF